MNESEDFKFKEISEEVIREYHQEKGVSPEEREQERQENSNNGVEQEKLTDSLDQPPSFTYQGQKDLKKKEEDKKTAVKERIKELLRLAEEKGLQQSIKQAEKENDPFLLDLYHDVLAKNNAYKKYLKE